MRESAIAILIGPARCLHDAVHGYESSDDQSSHPDLSFCLQFFSLAPDDSG
jgi:hypothetical protein